MPPTIYLDPGPTWTTAEGDATLEPMQRREYEFPNEGALVLLAAAAVIHTEEMTYWETTYVSDVLEHQHFQTRSQLISALEAIRVTTNISTTHNSHTVPSIDDLPDLELSQHTNDQAHEYEIIDLTGIPDTPEISKQTFTLDSWTGM